MKRITVADLAQVMSHPKKDIVDTSTEINEFDSKYVPVRRQVRRDGTAVFDAATETKEIKTLAVKSTITYGVAEDDASYTFFYSCKFDYCVADLQCTSISNLIEASKHSIEQGVVGCEVVDVKDFPEAQKAIDFNIEMLTISADSDLRSYLRENHEVKSGKYWSSPEGEPTHFYLVSDNEYDLSFEGHLVCECEDSRFGKYSLYEPTGDTCQYICQKISPDGVIDTKICDGHDEFMDYFGFDPLAKKLYYELGFKVTKIVTGEGLTQEAKRLAGVKEGMMKYLV